MKKLLGILLALASFAAVAQIPISQLPNAILPLSGTEQVIVNQTGTTKKTPVTSLSALSPPLNATYLLQSPNALVPFSRTLVGTANEILLADGGAMGNLVLSTPQPIATTSTPTFAGMTLTGGLTGTSATFSGTVGITGLLSGVNATFSGALAANSLALTTPLPATSGGTGFGTYTIGDLLSASTTTALSKITDVAAGAYLRSGGVATLPLWSTLTLPNAATTGDLLSASATNTVGNLADVSVGSYLRSGGVSTAPLYSTVKIPNTDVLGDLWVASAANVMTALPGNITATKNFLVQTGTGTVSASPSWGTIAASDLPGTFAGFANPTGTVGLTAVNGTATTAPRSDSAPALSQAIAPTWTAQHIFSQAFTSTGTAGNSPIALRSTQPGLSWSATAQAADSKVWDQFVTTTHLITQIDNDAGSVSKSISDYGRTANAVSSITFGNATDNPTFSILGTGLISRVASFATTLNIFEQNTNTGTTAVTQLQLANSADAFFSGISSTGSTTAPWIGGPATESAFVGNSGNVPLSIATNNTERIRVSGAGAVGIRSSSSGLNQMAFGTLSNNGSTCTVGNDNFGITSCTRTGTGNIQANFSSTTGVAYVCTAMVGGVGATFATTIVARTATAVSFQSYNGAGTITDAPQLDIVCY